MELQVSNPLKIKKEDCSGCTACKAICPVQCITMQPDNEGFLYPIVDKSTCTKCGLCARICPIENNNCKNPKRLPEPIPYAVRHKDEGVRKSSSSGGVFSAISDFILENGGVVVGAAFDKEFKVYHEIANTKQERDKFKGAKYVQSNMGNIFIQVKEVLKQEKNVLFSGTPCQVAGLYAFLRKDYGNLFTTDVICHGVPSPKVFEDYKMFLKQKFKSKIISYLSFRNWNANWRDSRGMKIVLDNHTYEKFYTDDCFYRLYFGRSFILRPSCHNCRFCSTQRIADVTLGDFWKIEQYHPNFAHHNKGVSLALINTEKGAFIFEKSKKNLIYIKSSIDNCTQRNLYQPTIANPYRKYFWKIYRYIGFPLASIYASYGIIKSKLKNKFI